jgi:hypothetical protein
VESRAFTDGQITLQPQPSLGLLTSTATVKPDAAALTYRVVLDCPDTLLGGRTSLTIVKGNRPSHGPATGFGGTADDVSGSTMLLTGGLTALAAGLALGVVTLRRRRTT